MKIKTKTARCLCCGTQFPPPCAARMQWFYTLRLGVHDTGFYVLLAIVDVFFKALAEAAAAATAAREIRSFFCYLRAARVWHLCSKNQWR